WGVGAVIRTGEALLSPEVDEHALRAAFGDRPRYLDLLLSLELTSTVVVPLVARERKLGALTFASAESGRRYGEADLQFAQELAASRRVSRSCGWARLETTLPGRSSTKKACTRPWSCRSSPGRGFSGRSRSFAARPSSRTTTTTWSSQRTWRAGPRARWTTLSS